MDWSVTREHARAGLTLAIVAWLTVEVIAHFARPA